MTDTVPTAGPPASSFVLALRVGDALKRLGSALRGQAGVDRDYARGTEAFELLAAAHLDLRAAEVLTCITVTAEHAQLALAEIDRLLTSLAGHTGVTETYLHAARSVRHLSAAVRSLRTRTPV